MLWHKKAQPLPWYGGKAGYGKAEWIASLLPWRKDSTYVEPFGGMAGVLLRRAPVKCEIFNDLDGRIVNWWRCVRNYRDELGELVEAMPHSEAEYQWAKGAVDDEAESDLQRALAFYVLATQSISQNLTALDWTVRYDDGNTRRWKSKRLDALQKRMWDVLLFCRPAEKILSRTSNISKAVIYVDPPYHTAVASNYSICELDIANLTALLESQQGKVAVSGYPGEWNHLGWQRHEREARMSAAARKNEPRTEVLWTNYDAHADTLPLFDVAPHADE